jgi:hypothetical protein
MPAEKFTVALDAVELPELDLPGTPASDDPKPAKPKAHKDRGRSTVGNHGLRAAPQAKRYAFRRS